MSMWSQFGNWFMYLSQDAGVGSGDGAESDEPTVYGMTRQFGLAVASTGMILGGRGLCCVWGMFSKDRIGCWGRR